MIRGILIDLDDTLADDRFAMEQAVLALWRAQSAGSVESSESLSTRWLSVTDKHWRRFRAGETSLQGQRRDRIAELFDQKISDSRADDLFNEYLDHYERNWRLVDGAVEFLAATSNLPKVIVTNSEVNQASRKIAALNLSGHFLEIVTPEVAGAPKPKPEIFKHAIGLLGLSATDCLMIGDSHEYDIQPAQALGMATFHVSRIEGRGLREAARAA